MKICIILGTRPEIIKFSPIIRTLEENQCEYFIIHTNQHYSENMDKIFFDSLQLRQPKFNLNVGSHSQGKQTGLMLERIESVLIEKNPDIVFVQGDTNSSFAGALAGKKLQIKIGHIEAGLRSYDERMPEEINRKLIDHISDYLFVPTENQKQILLNEGINNNSIFIVGNTIVDGVKENIDISDKKKYLKDYNLEKGNYFLVTFHRAENTNDKVNLSIILESLDKIYKKYQITLFCPMHPRTKKMIEKFNLKIPKGVILSEPVGYLPFLQMMKNAKLILTDSGGLQEEACILQVPCITLRDNTERPETVDVGANVVTGLNVEKIMEALSIMLNKKNQWNNPFGENVASKIVKIINNDVENRNLLNGR